MALVVCFGSLLGRDWKRTNLLALAALILLMVNPRELLNPGFQLSFLVVASLLVLAPVLDKRLEWVLDRLARRIQWFNSDLDQEILRMRTGCLGRGNSDRPLPLWNYFTSGGLDVDSCWTVGGVDHRPVGERNSSSRNRSLVDQSHGTSGCDFCRTSEPSRWLVFIDSWMLFSRAPTECSLDHRGANT